jgi:uncharacterized repeat protein (TIGR03803 family)
MLVFTALAAWVLLQAGARAQTYEVLHAFSNERGAPVSPLLLTADGSIYGTSQNGGQFGLGSVFVLKPNGSTFDFQTVWSFSGRPDGNQPLAGLFQDSDGSFYGTTAYGGDYSCGTVFHLDNTGSLTILHSFTCGDSTPSAGLVRGIDGRFYGTTSSTVFRIDSSGSFMTLHTLTSAEGLRPTGLVVGGDGKFYGLTTYGAMGHGTIFRIDALGSFCTVYSFSGPDGYVYSSPGYFSTAGLTLARDGHLYGTTRYGGQYGEGTVFRYEGPNSITILHQFAYSDDGKNPNALVQGQGLDDSLYGSTSESGVIGGGGSIFRMNTSGTSFVTLHVFTGHDGVNPASALIQSSDGSYLFGTTPGNGSPCEGEFGTVFSLDTAGVLANLHVFARPEGIHPFASLVQAGDGRFYGTTRDGGQCDYGTLFGLDGSGSLTTVHSFLGADDGINPQAPLIQDTLGNLYGTTGNDIATPQGLFQGTVFRVDTSGSLLTLHKFQGDPGAVGNSLGGLVRDGEGFFYGTTEFGGPFNNGGTIFRMDSSGAVSTLHEFHDYIDGYRPLAGLLRGSDGNFYGTATSVGPFGYGTVFKMDTSGTLTVLHSFNGSDGSYSVAALILGTDGNYYGTTASESDEDYPNDNGTIFRVSSTGSFTSLHAFSGDDGQYPWGALVLGSDGNFYGTTRAGGNGYGTIFRIDASGALTTLYKLNGNDGAFPHAGLIQGSDGGFYGTSTEGGPYGVGVVFRLTVPLTCFPAVQISGPGAVCAGQSVTLDAGPGFSSYLWSTGATTQTITVAPSVTATYTVSVLGLYGCTGSANKTVTVNPAPAVPTITEMPNGDGSVTLTSSSEAAYLWSTGATTQAITVSTSGAYQVTVINATGCSSTSATTNVAITPTGSSVSSVDGSVTTTFTSVSTGGTTTVIPIDPSTAGTLPSGGYSLSGLGIAYNISTTASYSGNLIIAFVVPSSVDEVTFNGLRILHGEGGVLVDRTYFSPDGCSPTPTAPCPAPNFATRTIYAQVSSLSPFVLGALGTPVIEYITVPSAPVAVSTALSVQARFTDPGTHTASWAWGDSTTSSGTVTESNGIGNVTGSHAYTAAGVYQAILRVTDSGGLVGQKVSTYIVIYDPNGGFVTGGGTFSSLAGAYVAHPSSTGSANFGFVAKYPKNGGSPTGDTEFHFSDLNFHSSSYDWLVVSGPKAQYQGSGTVNGAGNFGFKVTVIDGQASGGGTDKIRVKIWDKNNGNVLVYDNQMGAPDSANPTTAIGGGSIVLHN